jgi:phage-related protein
MTDVNIFTEKMNRYIDNVSTFNQAANLSKTLESARNIDISVLPPVSDFVDKFDDALGSVTDTINAVGDTIDNAMNSANKLFEILTPPDLSQIVAKLESIPADLFNKVETVASAAANTVNNIKSKFKVDPELEKNPTGKDAGGVQKGTTAAEKIKEKVNSDPTLSKRMPKKSFLPEPVKNAISNVNDTTKAFNSFMLESRDKISQAAGKAQEIMQMGKDLLNTVSDVKNQVVGAIGDTIGAISDAIKETVGPIVGPIADALGAINDVKDEIFGSIGAITEALSVPLLELSQIKQEMLATVGEISAPIRDIENRLAAMGFSVSSDGLGTVSAKLDALAGSSMFEYVDKIVDVGNKAQNIANKMALPRLNTISGFPGKMADLLNKKMDNTAKAAENVANKINPSAANKREAKITVPDKINYI